MGKFNEKAYSIVLCLFLLASCSSDVKEKQLFDSNLSFAKSDVRVISSSESPSLNPYAKIWPDLYKAKKYRFQTCLKDTATILPLLGESFSINKQNVKTDVNGCLTWVDNFEYSEINKKGYIKKDYLLVGLDHYKGSLNIPLYINPWSNDLLESISGNVNIFMSHKMMRNDFLSIQGPKVSYQVTNQDKNKIDFDLEFGLQRKIYNEDGSIDLKVLSSGEFLTTISFIEHDLDTNTHILVAQLSSQKSILKDKISLNNLTTKLIKNPKSTSKLYIQLEVTPLSNKHVLNTIKGHIQVESFIERSDYPFIYKDIKFNYSLMSQYVSIAKDYKENESSFFIQNVSFAKGSILRNQGTNKRQINIKICLKNAFDRNSMIKDTNFKLKVLNNINQYDANTTDMSSLLNSSMAKNAYNPILLDNGCLEENILVDYDEYAPRNWQHFILAVEGVNAPFKGNVAYKNICINPFNDKADFALYDYKRCKKVFSHNTDTKIKVEKVKIRFQENLTKSYTLNSQLHLNFKQVYQLDLSPYLKVYDTSIQKFVTQKIYESEEFEVELLFLNSINPNTSFTNPNLNDFSPFAFASAKGSIQNGKLMMNFTLPVNFSSLPFLMEKSLVTLRLTAKDKKIPSVIITDTFMGKETKNESELDNATALINITDHGVFSKLKKKTLAMLEQKKNASYENLKSYRQRLYNNIKSKEENSQVILHSLKELNNRITIYNEQTNRILKKRGAKESLNILTPNELSQLTSLDYKSETISKDILAKLCTSVFGQIKYDIRHNQIKPKSSSSDTLKCINDPKKYLHLTPQTFMVNVDKKSISVEFKEGLTEKGKSYMIAKTFTTGTDVGFTTGTEAHLGPMLAPLSWIGFNAGAGGYYEGFNRRFDTEAVQEFTRHYLNRVELKLHYQQVAASFIADTQKCVLVEKRAIFVPERVLQNRGNKKKVIKAHFYKKDKGVLHLCDNKIYKNQTLTENYYLILQRRIADNGGLVDNEAVQFANMTRVIRGELTFNNFWQGIQDDYKYIVLKKSKAPRLGFFEQFMMENSVAVPIENIFDQSYPGVIIPSQVD